MQVETIGKCKSCGEMKALARYQKAKAGRFYFRKHCVQCWSAERNGYQRQYREENSERLKTYDRKKYQRDPAYQAAIRKRHYEKLKTIVYDHYGRSCSCCGESEPKFLTIDHINNDGAEHRKEVSAGVVLFKWLANNGFPNTFQILCFNCNSGRYHNGGVCPHEVARMKLAMKSGG